MGFITLEELKIELGISFDTDKYDSFLNRKISSVTNSIKRYCQRDFESAERTQTVNFPKNFIYLDEFPVSSVASVVVDGVTLESSQYLADSESGLLYLLDESGYQKDWKDYSGPPKQVVITYTAGYSSIPDEIKDIVFSLCTSAFMKIGGDPTKDVKMEAIHNSVTVSYFDSGYIDPEFGRFLPVLSRFRAEKGMLS